MSLLVVGSVALDTVETVHGRREDLLGGSAVYASVAASLFGPVKLVGVAGHDFPDEHIGFLRSRGVDIDGLELSPGATFRWSGRYHADMNRRETLLTALGVFERFEPRLPASYRTVRYAFLGNIMPELQLRVLAALERPLVTVLDTMDLWVRNERAKLLQAFARVTAVALNDEEARLLTGEPNLVRAARAVLRMGPSIAIVKKGEHGALLVTRDALFALPAFPVEEVRDPTGAGDTFAGAMLGWLASSDGGVVPSLAQWRRALVHGTALASFVVEDFGLERSRRLTRADVDARVAALLDAVRVD